MKRFSNKIIDATAAIRLQSCFPVWLLLLFWGHAPLLAQLNVNIFTDTNVDVSGGTQVSVTGNWINQGNLIFEDGTVVFTGEGNQILSSPTTETFSGFIVNKPSGTLTVNFKMTVTENLALLSGTFDNSNFDVILDEGAFLIRDGGVIVNPPLTSGRQSFWPPNHKYITIDMRDFFGSSVIITSATSDEPDDAKGNGDGNTKNDIVILNGCKRIKLRSERQGNGNGRVYTVYVSLDNGATTSALSRFIVPHDKKDKMAGVDEDAHVVPGKCSAISLAGNGTQQMSSAAKPNSVIASPGLAESYELFQNYPNPFNPNTTLSFALPKASEVKLAIYDVRGQLVKTLVSDQLEPGYYNIHWDGLNEVGERAASGVYIYRMEASNHISVKKMLLVK